MNHKKKVLQTVTQNKILVIDLVAASLQKDRISSNSVDTNWWYIGRDPIPVEINKGIVIRRCDLKTVQKETGVIMSQQMIAISEVIDGAGIRVMFDATDVFVLLLHFYRL